MPELDVDIRLSLQDSTRRFDLDVRFRSRAPSVALYGPSGAGKSLTLQALAGLVRPRQGHIRLGDQTLFDARRGIDRPPQHRGLGYLFQDYALFPHLTVQQNIEFGLRSWSRRRIDAQAADRVRRLMEGMGLSELGPARPAALSGGQRQRVALARALACEPQMLLLDEPFAALNPMLRAQLRADLANLRQAWGVPIVMISHDVDDVLALADVACVIEQGRVVREVDVRAGTATERLRHDLAGGAKAARRVDDPRHQRVRELLMPPVSPL